MRLIYLLPVESIGNVDVVKGVDLIHNAILEGTEAPMVRKLIMNTTPDENTALAALALEVRVPTSEEAALELPPYIPPPPDPAIAIGVAAAAVVTEIDKAFTARATKLTETEKSEMKGKIVNLIAKAQGG